MENVSSMGTPNMVVRDASTLITSTIFPAKPTQEEQCLLSPFDLQFAETLVYFYPLAGRLAESPDGFLHFKCNDAGVRFTVVTADATLDHILLDKSGRAMKELFPMNDCSCADGRSLPLLAVRSVTQLRGAVAMAFTLNHMLVDGYSTWHFINSWSQICRGSLTISNPSLHHRFGWDSRKQNDKYKKSVQGLQRLLPLSDHLQEAVFHFGKYAMTGLSRIMSTPTRRR